MVENLSGGSSLLNSAFVCLFELGFYGPVNPLGHVKHGHTVPGQVLSSKQLTRLMNISVTDK